MKFLHNNIPPTKYIDLDKDDEEDTLIWNKPTDKKKRIRNENYKQVRKYLFYTE